MRPNIEEKHAKIKAKFEKLYKEGYRQEIVAQKLASEFYMSPNTILNLVWGTAGYGQKKKSKKDLDTNS